MGAVNSMVEIDTAGTAKQIRKRINQHMKGDEFDVESIQTEIVGDTMDDELLRVRVWMDGDDGRGSPHEVSSEWKALERLKETINTDSTLSKVAAGTVSATNNHLQIVYPKSKYEVGKFKN